MCFSVVSEPRGRGGYICAMYLGGRLLRALDADAAAAYCAEWTWAISCAEHDAAVLKQLTEMGIAKRYVAQPIRHLRADRRPIIEAAAAPVTLAPIVSGRTGEGLVQGSVDGVRFQWDLTTARTHVMYVAEVSAASVLDTAYSTHLRGIIGLDDTDASKYVTRLRSYMPSTTGDHEHPPPATP